MVYSAHFGNKLVAVKFLTNFNSKKLERFKAEYLNISIIKNDKLFNVVRPIHFDELPTQEKIPYIIMPFYPLNLTRSRDELLKFYNYVPLDSVLDLLKNLMECLISLFHLNIIHRDIKPDNIMFDIENKTFLLTDFGIAHFSNNFPINNLTQTGERLANFKFASPEQRDNKDVTFATDVYSMFLVIYWFVFGEICSGTDRKSLYDVYNNNDSKILDLIMDKGLSNFPENRPSITDIVEKLNKLNIKKDIYRDMKLLSEAILSVIPEAWNKFYCCKDKKQIDEIINNFSCLQTDELLWFNTGYGNNEIKRLESLDNGNYLLNEHELKIISLWLCFDNSLFNDIIIIEVESPKPYEVEGEKCPSVTIVNGCAIRNSSTVDSGFIRINGKVKKVEDLNIEYRDIWNLKSGRYIAIGTFYQCSIFKDNDEYIRDLQKNEELTANILLDYRNIIRQHKHDEVEKGL